MKPTTHLMGDEPFEAFCGAFADADPTGFVHLTPLSAKVDCPACLGKMKPAVHLVGRQAPEAFCGGSADVGAVTGFPESVTCPACLDRLRASIDDLTRPAYEPNVTTFEEPGWPDWWPAHGRHLNGYDDCERCDLEREAMEDNVYEQQLAVYDDANAWRADA